MRAALRLSRRRRELERARIVRELDRMIALLAASYAKAEAMAG